MHTVLQVHHITACNQIKILSGICSICFGLCCIFLLKKKTPFFLPAHTVAVKFTVT